MERSTPILAGFNAGSCDREPIEFGLAASRITGAPLVILTVRVEGLLASRLDVSPDEEARTLELLRIDLASCGLAADVRKRTDRSVGGGLTAAIAELAPRMVVLGTTHRSAAGSALLGTTIERVVHAAACPVAVVPHGYRRPEAGVRVVGAAFAPTEEGTEALRAAAAVARAGGAQLRAILVLDPKHAEEQAPGMLAALHRDAAPQEAVYARRRRAEEARLDDTLAEVARDVDAEVDVLFNNPADGLVAASRHLDLLVVGSRARGPRRAVVFGSVSRQVAQRAACPVMILPRGAGQMTEALISQAGTWDAP